MRVHFLDFFLSTTGKGVTRVFFRTFSGHEPQWIYVVGFNQTFNCADGWTFRSSAKEFS
ncbi:hypothetical protein LEP1GSC161_0271 [Leptospira santarosai str. CBC1416]|uniref:Uncharacterized protein n=1 Tax=Leptospira santarosai str. CBC1416 TaxID=1193059 RepID=M6VVL4_9LEPT|nr:hypothetical protein LEP1GSC161_0271 [Leptospira santarosai str. CBC1416]